MGLIAFVLPPAIYLALEAKQGLGRATLAAHGALLALTLALTLTLTRARALTLTLALTLTQGALLALGLLVTVGATGKVLAAKLQAS